MQHAARIPLLLSHTNLSVPIAALLLGAAVGAGTIALADTDELDRSPANVIVLGPAPDLSEGVAAKDEAGVAAAISFGPEFRGSKASVVSPPVAEPEPTTRRPAGPRGLAAGLSGRGGD